MAQWNENVHVNVYSQKRCIKGIFSLALFFFNSGQLAHDYSLKLKYMLYKYIGVQKSGRR